jgi:hypothetical protein
MYELLLVKEDGTVLGRPKASPGLAPGYYVVNGKGTAIPAPTLQDYGLYECVSEREAVSLEGDKYYSISGAYPMLEAGTLVRLFKVGGRYVEYYLVEGQSDLLDRLASWWSGWGKKKVWSQGQRRMLNPRRITYAKEHKVEEVVNAPTSVGLTEMPEICKRLAAKVTEQLDKTKELINLKLAPIGGVVTAIYPYWQRHFPVVWVHFKVNGVEPTRGQGCLCYLTGDFYYGPWCQRFGQHNTDGATHMIYEYPPSYSIVDWICGPLYEASRRHGSGDYYFSGRVKLPQFEPSNFAVAVYGEARPGQGKVNFNRLVEDLPKGEARIDLAKLKQALKNPQELPEIEGDFTILQKWELDHDLIMASVNGWRRQTRYDKHRYDDKYLVWYGPAEAFDPKSLYKVGVDDWGCTCGYCKRYRKDVLEIAVKPFLARLGLQEQPTLFEQPPKPKFTWEAIPSSEDVDTWAQRLAQTIEEENLKARKALDENIPF